jgi:hypothetical protein
MAVSSKPSRGISTLRCINCLLNLTASKTLRHDRQPWLLEWCFFSSTFKMGQVRDDRMPVIGAYLPILRQQVQMRNE